MPLLVFCVDPKAWSPRKEVLSGNVSLFWPNYTSVDTQYVVLSGIANLQFSFLFFSRVKLKF